MEDRIYKCISTLIDVGNTDDAQAMLDDAEEKDARWHYLQCQIYLVKNWTNEARKQLETAVELDHENEKYKKELEALKSAVENENGDGQAQMGNGKFRKFCGDICACCQSCCEGCVC